MTKPSKLCPTRNTECNAWTEKTCGFAVVEGKCKCRLVDEVVGFGEGWVSPLRYEDGEERCVYW